MKLLFNMTIAVFVLICLFAQDLKAGSLSDDYQALVNKRIQLESIRKKHEARLIALSSQKKSLTIVFYQCISQKNKDFWEQKLAQANKTNTELEKERIKLNGLRKNIDIIRRDLEKRRIEIENKHTHKGPNTPYEKEFRQYMNILDKEYFEVLKNELFAGYNSYLSNVENYISSLKETVGICMKRNLN